MQLKIPLCPKHEKPAIIICSFQSCKDPILCEVCKQKQILHFSNHANYFQKLQKIKQFDNAKRTQQQLEKGIADCQAFVVEHRKFYSQQITAIKEDFLQMRKLFMSIADKYEQIYIFSFKKQIQKFDQQINSLKRMLREYVEQKNQQQSIFNIFFPNNQPDKQNDQSLQGLIKKNSKAFKVRADIINLRSSLAISKNSQIKYKATQGSQNNLRIIFQQLDSVSKAIYDKFKDVLFADSNINDDLKGSIVNQSKSLAISKVSVGNLMDLYKSQATNSTSQPILQNVQFPPLDPVVNSVRQKLRPIQPKNPNIAFEGPYLYSTGVYYGQYQNKKRHGWGQFAFHNGSIYQGQWQNDAISGYGRLIRNDCYYEGDVRNGKANGSGTYEDHYRHYSGQWKNDKRNGIGQQEYKNKQKSFTGGFLDDKYHGKGRLITPEYVYEGKFKQGLFNGDGRIKYKNDQTFEGNFVDGQKHMGRHTYPDGSYYDGMYKDNVPNGTGQFFWSDGVKYSGQWRGGIQEGAGVQILQNGKEMKGIWRNGKWQKWI